MKIDDIVDGFEEAAKTPEFAYEKLVLDMQEEVAKAMKQHDWKRDRLAYACNLPRATIDRYMQDAKLTLQSTVRILHAVGLELKVVKR